LTRWLTPERMPRVTVAYAQVSLAASSSAQTSSTTTVMVWLTAPTAFVWSTLPAL
jgi:hypothetical protein